MHFGQTKMFHRAHEKNTCATALNFHYELCAVGICNRSHLTLWLHAGTSVTATAAADRPLNTSKLKALPPPIPVVPHAYPDFTDMPILQVSGPSLPFAVPF